MSIAVASLAFEMYFQPELRFCLDDVMKTLKEVYVPTNRKSDVDENSFQVQIEEVDSMMRKIHVKKPEPSQEEKVFETLLNDANSVLFYLSNVHNQRAIAEGQEPPLKKPIEVVYSIIDVFKYADDLEKEYLGPKKEEINVYIPQKKGHTDSIDMVVIDDPKEHSQIKILIEEKAQTKEQKISIEENDQMTELVHKKQESITSSEYKNKSLSLKQAYQQLQS